MLVLLSAACALGQSVDALWEGFERTDWLAGAEARRGDPSCRPPDPEKDQRFGLPAWCRLCVAETNGLTLSSAYYAFLEDGGAKCRLTQFQGVTGELGGSEAKRLYDVLLERAEKQHGPGRDPGKVYEFGSAYWKPLRQWDTSTLRIQLFIDEPPGRAPRVELLARHRLLVAAVETESRTEWYRWEYARLVRDRLASLLVPEVTPVLPKIGALLRAEDARHLDPGAIRSHIETLQRLLSTASEGRKPVYLLAIDRLAEQLAPHLPEPHDETRLTLTSAKLQYEYSHLGLVWIYTHDLLRRVWSEYPETRWGEQAFLSLQAAGWYCGCCCPEDPALFTTVIEQGERFLARRPNTEYRADLQFMLAAAYETWWSVANAPATDVYVTRNYAKGADLARQRAIEQYQTVVALTPKGRMADYARQRLPNLNVGADTRQRWYYCIYD